MGDQRVATRLPAHTGQHKQNKRTQTSMSQVEIEPTIPMFEREKTVHAQDRASTVIGRDIHKAAKTEKNAETYPSSSAIRSHDLSVRASEDISCRRRDHCELPLFCVYRKQTQKEIRRGTFNVQRCTCRKIASPG
jgi:hypothetical protein